MVLTIGNFEQYLLDCGAHKAKTVDVKDIVFDRGFRSLCESNACGNYGKSWTCPPYAGDIDDLIAIAKTFDKAIVYQTIGELEDSYDFEGMMDAAAVHNKLTSKVKEDFKNIECTKVLHLGAGGCHVCPVCAKKTDEPCRFPDKALASLETYGVAVSQLADIAEMKYINGENTVTYFSAVFYAE